MKENRTPFIAYHPDYLPKLPKSTGFPLINFLALIRSENSCQKAGINLRQQRMNPG
ncbi:MAG: hypothetical protein J0H55_07000 [Chitinophagaceae bacterium]|nr:hypothetical protein [Chitinophagaceae bacterium]